MTAKILLLAVWSVIAALLAPPQSGLVSPLAAPGSPSGADVIQPQWTVWGAEQYALADDGVFIWIGGVGGVMQFDKGSGTYRRYTTLDGLPQTQVRAIVVDAAGNRWFGGIGGLSRLDKDGAWTHFTTANSGLHRDGISGLALVGGDTLYAWHGLADGSVSRLAPDGTWQWLPNRETAVKTDYADIVARGSSLNPIWTVAGAEIWAGEWAYDGARWHHRPLPHDYFRIAGSVADRDGHVWVWTGGRDVFEWVGDKWESIAQPPLSVLLITALAVDRDGKVWAASQEQVSPYGIGTVTVRDVGGANPHALRTYGPVGALLATGDGLWAVGPGWLMTPDFKVTYPPDMPRYESVWDAAVTPGGAIWLTSRMAPESYGGELQALDDRGTRPLADDIWQEPRANAQTWCGRVTAFERQEVDLWYASYCYSRGTIPPEVMRYHAGATIAYKLPPAIIDGAPSPWSAQGEVTDIFAQDSRHTWLALVGKGYGNGDYVFGLDDGGTPADLSDDKWQTLEVKTAGDWMTVAVDAQGRLWRGQQDGLYRYDGGAWQRVFDERAVCDIAPAADGTMFARVEASRGAGCATYSDLALAVRPDGKMELTSADWLLYRGDDLTRARSATRRNSLWTMSADGALWYVKLHYTGDTLIRLSAGGRQSSYALPVKGESLRRVEVDGRGRVWLVGDGKLWRMEGPPINRLYLPLLHR